MSVERFLVTGALGCIGAWTVRNLIREGVVVATFDRGSSLHRLQLLLTTGEIASLKIIQGDISQFDQVAQAFQDFQPTHVIHLAAMQFPFCKADPVLGAQVNVVGTVNVFEAARRVGLRRLVYASTTAVYGISEEYGEGSLPHDALLKPRSHYGVYKQANEGTARVYWLDDGISSIGLRPYTVYGAGRDQGMTSTPTKAMLAAAVGRAYNISFGGRCAFQYGEDMGKVFIRAARAAFEGAGCFNIGGESVSVPQVITAIEAVEPALRGKLTYNDAPLPFPPDVDNAALVSILGPLPSTPLQQGVAETIQIFKAAIGDGRITAQDVENILK
jgi:nucleoside-diphosphate-sugar epimerase